jgi:protein-S-isoprenylcysteine O-methyltransferase Ste14
MNRLNFFGIGPKMATVLLPWLTAAIVISYITDKIFTYVSVNSNVVLIAGTIIMALGLIFYFSTIRQLLKGLKETKLMTKGAYSLCQNPLYSSIILFIIPGLSLILNSWLVLTSSIIGYILFKIYITKEYKELEIFFGEEYLKYKNSTPEFFPLSFKKWFS